MSPASYRAAPPRVGMALPYDRVNSSAKSSGPHAENAWQHSDLATSGTPRRDAQPDGVGVGDGVGLAGGVEVGGGVTVTEPPLGEEPARRRIASPSLRCASP